MSLLSFLVLNELKQKRHINILVILHSIFIKFADQTIGRICSGLYMKKAMGCLRGPSLGPSLGPFLIKTSFCKKWTLLIIFYIYNASASKRIIANQLGCNICQPLKFQFFYYLRAMLKNGSSSHVPSNCVMWRRTQFILVQDNRTP